MGMDFDFLEDGAECWVLEGPEFKKGPDFDSFETVNVAVEVFKRVNTERLRLESILNGSRHVSRPMFAMDPQGSARLAP
jgi:hypothetical protein